MLMHLLTGGMNLLTRIQTNQLHPSPSGEGVCARTCTQTRLVFVGFLLLLGLAAGCR